MKIQTAALLTLGILAVAGVASAAKGEELAEIDLKAVQQGSYYLGCSGTDNTAHCGVLGLWQEINGKPGLQRASVSGASFYERDNKLTP